MNERTNSVNDFDCGCNIGIDLRDSIRKGSAVEQTANLHTENGYTCTNILPHFRDHEYFLFIDFRGEHLMSTVQTKDYRGSLFTNQELAIAIYLNKEIIAFQEEGIKKLDGMLSAIQANVIPF